MEIVQGETKVSDILKDLFGERDSYYKQHDGTNN